MKACMSLLPTGKWGIKIMPEDDMETQAILAASPRVWEVIATGALLFVTPTEELKKGEAPSGGR